jgi:hypothetical protein
VTESDAPPGGDRAEAGSAAESEHVSGSWAPGGGQDEQPAASASTGSAGPGLAAPVLRSHSRARWVVVGIVAVLALLGGAGAWQFATAHRVGHLALPDRLLGLSRYSGPDAQILEHKIEDAARAASDGNLGAGVAALYGPAGGGLGVVAAAACSGGPCVVLTAGQLVQALRAHGAADARSFSPGPGGAVLVCYSQTLRGATVIWCYWIDQVAAGEVTFGGGLASGLADAAAKTGRVRAAIEQ